MNSIAEKRPIADALTDPAHRLDRKPQSVLVRSAPAVGTLVVERREELPRQIAVGDMKLDAVETGRNGAAGGILVALQNIFNLMLFEFFGGRTAGNFARRHLARREHVGIVFVGIACRVGLQERCRRSQTEMQKLHRKRAAVPLHRPRHIGEPLELRIVPQAGKPKRRIDRVFIDQMPAENDHAKPGLGALLVIGDRLLGKNTLVRAPNPGRTNRAEYHAIRKRRVADAQRREQMAIRSVVGHVVPPSCRAFKSLRSAGRRRCQSQDNRVAAQDF